MKLDHWTNGICCSALSVFHFPCSHPSQVGLFQFFCVQHFFFLNSWASKSVRWCCEPVCNLATLDLILSGKQGRLVFERFCLTATLFSSPVNILQRDKCGTFRSDLNWRARSKTNGNILNPFLKSPAGFLSQNRPVVLLTPGSVSPNCWWHCGEEEGEKRKAPLLWQQIWWEE